MLVQGGMGLYMVGWSVDCVADRDELQKVGLGGSFVRKVDRDQRRNHGSTE